VNHYVVICGGRDPDDETLAGVDDVLRFLHLFYEDTLRVMHGAAPGVDTRAQEICDLLGVPVKAYPADWSRGKQAGPERNRKMAQLLIDWMRLGHSAEVIAFKGGSGTKHMATHAGLLGINVTHVPLEEAWNVDVDDRAVSNCADGKGRREERRDDPERQPGLFDSI